jgi:predicted dehydrogenase
VKRCVTETQIARHIIVEYGPLISFVELFTMTKKTIRVGIVDANAKSGWARVSHIPVINGLPNLKLAAVATRNEQSAREAAEAFGADRWFSDPLAMIRDDLVDLVTIAVNVPAHRELVLAALHAGKAVYCEAPLGRTLTETEEMAHFCNAGTSDWPLSFTVDY